MRKLKVTAAVGGAVVCTFAACAGGPEGPASRQASFSEAEAAACMAAWQVCVDDGGDESACKLAYQECAYEGDAETVSEPSKDDPNAGDTGGEPVPETDPGSGGGCPDFDYGSCVESGGTPEECKAKLEICQALPPVEPNPDEPKPDEPPPVPSAEEECQKLTAACFESAEDPSVCKEKYEACVSGFYPEVVPEPVANDCAAAAQACFDAGEDPEVCKKKHEICLGYEPQPAFDLCQDAFAACLAAGVDEVTCKEKLEACEGWFVEPPTDPNTGSDEKGNACLAGLDACLGVATSETQVDACYNGFQACDWSVRQAEGGAGF